MLKEVFAEHSFQHGGIRSLSKCSSARGKECRELEEVFDILAESLSEALQTY